MLKKQKDENELVGNDRYEGFCVDLLEQISDQVGFKYIIELVPDNNYGALNLTSGRWNGLVKGNVTNFIRDCHKCHSGLSQFSLGIVKIIIRDCDNSH